MYNHAPEDYVCPLCAIVAGTMERGPMFTPGDLVYIDGRVAALISAYQWPKNPGNVIVIPVVHYENIFDLPHELAEPVHALSRAIALAMKSAWSCDGISIRQHNEPAGNQDTWHYHVHITPRYMDDRLYATYMEGKHMMPAEERARYGKELRKHIRTQL